MFDNNHIFSPLACNVFKEIYTALMIQYYDKTLTKASINKKNTLKAIHTNGLYNSYASTIVVEL